MQQRKLIVFIEGQKGTGKSTLAATLGKLPKTKVIKLERDEDDIFGNWKRALLKIKEDKSDTEIYVFDRALGTEYVFSHSRHEPEDYREQLITFNYNMNALFSPFGMSFVLITLICQYVERLERLHGRDRETYDDIFVYDNLPVWIKWHARFNEPSLMVDTSSKNASGVYAEVIQFLSNQLTGVMIEMPPETPSNVLQQLLNAKQAFVENELGYEIDMTNLPGAIVGLNGEVGEMLEMTIGLNNKPWADTFAHAFDTLEFEAIDCLFYLLEVFLHLGMDEAKIWEYFQLKLQENKRRVVEGK